MKEIIPETLSSTRALDGGASIKKTKLRKTCAEFESLLINYILKTGRESLPGNGLFDNSHESRIYKSMMDEQLARSVAQARGLGLGELLYRQLKQDDETPHAFAELA